MHPDNKDIMEMLIEIDGLRDGHDQQQHCVEVSLPYFHALVLHERNQQSETENGNPYNQSINQSINRP